MYYYPRIAGVLVPPKRYAPAISLLLPSLAVPRRSRHHDP